MNNFERAVNFGIGMGLFLLIVGILFFLIWLVLKIIEKIKQGKITIKPNYDQTCRIIAYVLLSGILTFSLWFISECYVTSNNKIVRDIQQENSK